MITALLLLASALAAGEWVPLEVIATAYDPCRICCGTRAQGITADGTRTRDESYGIAADPRSLASGTIVWIPTGVGYLDRQFPGDAQRQFRVDDTGGAIIRNTRETGIVHLDLRFIHHRNAVRFGRKRITVYIWKD